MTPHPSLRSWVSQDLATNAGSPQSQVVVALFRLAQWMRRHGRPRVLAQLVVRIYQVLTYMGMHVELPPDLEIGPGLRIYHPHGIVLNPSVVIGRDCVLRHGVTIGNTGTVDGPGDCPVLGDGVEIGAGALILGPITVGDHARVGAGAVVVKSVPDYGVIVGNPGTIIRVGAPAEDSGQALA